MSNFIQWLRKILKASPLIFLALVIVSDLTMHLTSNYKTTPTPIDDVVYKGAEIVSGATKQVMQACDLTTQGK